MRFDFCGSVDCPEWALAEVSLLNRISAVKLKLILVQIVKKISGSPSTTTRLLSYAAIRSLTRRKPKCASL